ncbi:hypothetical protein CEXT_324881 [Caerostris extrusa]|uniref:Uncharacterized protein n=1 Tax=Caerostris extrusa TaxID=172846 RepID=A0AAV4MEJ2_CAEEX|nr:hypothetical protein CEXT_324881 [Caerostris extrusa]
MRFAIHRTDLRDSESQITQTQTTKRAFLPLFETFVPVLTGSLRKETNLDERSWGVRLQWRIAGLLFSGWKENNFMRCFFPIGIDCLAGFRAEKKKVELFKKKRV